MAISGEQEKITTISGEQQKINGLIIWIIIRYTTQNRIFIQLLTIFAHPYLKHALSLHTFSNWAPTPQNTSFNCKSKIYHNMQHLYTRYSETHSSLRNVFARLRQSVLANSLRTITLLFVLALSCNVWGELTSYHTPGIYTTTWKQKLTVYQNREYEIYGFSSTKSSKNYIWAGTSATSGDNIVLSFATTTATEKDWISNKVNGCGSSFSSKKIEEFTLSGREMNYRNNSELIILVEGYDQFSMYGKDASNNGTKSFVVTIDGNIVTTGTSTKETIRRYDISTSKHIIKVTANGTSNCVLNGFSLRLPSCTKPDITTQPVSATYPVGATPTQLQVAATGEGTLTYQWQSSTDNATFANISNETSNTYTPPTDKAGTTYYRCIVSSGSCSATSATATITIAADNTIYLKPNSNWRQNNARFAVYYWDASNTGWADMTRISECEEVYMAQIPANYTNIIFCRMNPSSVGNNFDNGTVWNRTEDLTIGNSNLYELTEDNNNWSTGSWKTYTPIECIDRWYVSGDFNNFDLTHPFTDNQVAITLAANTTYQFKIQHQVGNTYTWFGNSGTMTSTNCTDWNFGSLGQDDTNAKITTTIAGAYLFTMSVNPNGTPKLTVTYPTLHTITYQEGRPAEYDSSLTTSGIPTSTTQVADGGALTLPAYTTIKITAESGNTTIYEFAGWSDGKTTYPANQTAIDNITSDLTLTATWQPVSFNIYYWDGQNEDNSQNKAINGLTPTTYTYASKDLLPTDAAAITDAAGKQGVVFKNWKVRDWSQTTFTLKDLDYTTPHHLYGDINLYAEWEEEVGCVVIFKAVAKVETSGNCSNMEANPGTVSVNNSTSVKEDAVKLNGDGYIELKPKTGKTFLAGDQLHVTFKNNNSSNKQMGFCIKKDDGKTITETRSEIPVKANSTAIDTYTLQEDDINKDGSIRIYRLSGDDRFYAIQVEQCPNVETVTATVLPGGGIIDEANATSLGYSKSVQSNGVIWYTITVAKGSHITLPTATFEGYKFESYQAQDASLTKYGAGAVIVLNENQTFIAQWLPLSTGKVKATLNLNGGTFKNQAEANLWQKEPGTTESYYILIDKGANLTLPELTHPAGKTFVCFTDQDDDTYYPSNPFPLPDNYDFVAQWCSSPVILTWTKLNANNTFTINSTSTVPIPLLQTSGLPTDGIINYISDNEAVATISDDGTLITPYMAGRTTITAMFDGTGDYCPAKAAYTLIVECSDPTPVIETNNMSLGCNTAITLCVKMKSTDGTNTNTDYPATGYSFQWYKNSKPIDGATGSTYTVQTVGDYFVVVHQFCYVKSENTAHITSAEDAAVPEVVRMSPFLFYRPGHTYPAEQATRHLFAYKSASGNSKDCLLSAVHKRNDVRTEIDATDLTFLQTSDATDAQGRYTVTTSLNNIPASLGWQAGDIIMVTLTPYDNCGQLSTAYADSIAIRIIDRPALAFIVSSADKPTRNRKEFKLHGDFLKINEADLYEQTPTDWKKWDPNASHNELPLYTAIKAEFEVVPVNGYADFNILNYEPFDIIVLTDFLRTTMGQGDKIAPVIDSLAKLVDYRPLLSLKAHMAKEEFPTWRDKGFTGNPATPSSTQKDMTVLCLAHGIFVGLDDYEGPAPTDDDYANKIIYDANGNIVVRITSKGGYDKKDKKDKEGKALQGFKAVDAANFVNIAIISDGGSGSLVTCCERQANINARMLVLSVNADATSLITPIGQQAIIKGLEYLLQNAPIHVSDCSITFDNGGESKREGSGNNLWSNPANWDNGRVPLKEQNVQIAANCIVDQPNATASAIKIVQGNTLTINPTGALVANGKIWAIPSRNDKHNTQPVSDPRMITILSSETATGALIHTTDADEQLAATVQLYSKAYFEWVDGKRKKYWQYVGVPIQEAQVPQCFNGSYTWLWSEPDGWVRKADGTSLEQFRGYGLSTGVAENERVTYTLQGTLATAVNRDIPLTISNATEAYKGTNMIGNSWTAPIRIDKMIDTDFGTAPATVYIYNTGRDPESGPTAGDQTTTTAGQWMSIPVNVAKQSGYAGPKVIPAMQAFDVLTTTETSLYLDYDRLVRSNSTDINKPLYAPKRTAEKQGQVAMMHVTVADNRTHTSLYLLEDEAFSDRFDNGWEAEFMSGDGRSASLYAISPLGNMAVLALSDVDGTTLGFEPGRENQYTFSFRYTGRMLYLNDIQQRKSTLITDWNTYTFLAGENDMPNRFYISSTPIEAQTPTNLADISVQNGILRINNPAHENLSIGIYDAAGRLCALSHTAEAMADIILPATQGVYLIHINGENTRIVRKVTR